MRTTLRIDDDLLRELKQQAQRESTPLTELVNRVIRRGLERTGERRAKLRRQYRERSFSLGAPRVPLDKALSLAAAMEDAEAMEKMARRRMKLVDLNVLLYAVNEDAAQHASIRAWWESAVNGDEPIALPWVVILGFLRLATHPRVFPTPLSTEQALAKVDQWLAQPSIRVLQESAEQWRILRSLLEVSGMAGNLTTDAHLASLAIAHGAVLVSCDTDFRRFAKLQWEHPLTDSSES